MGNVALVGCLDYVDNSTTEGKDFFRRAVEIEKENSTTVDGPCHKLSYSSTCCKLID